MTTVFLAAGDDSASLKDRISTLLGSQGMSVAAGPCPLPEPWETTLVLCLLSARMLADPALVAFLEEAAQRGLPVVPVVEDFSSYDFDAVPVRLLSSRNAVGWQPGDGQFILQTVRGYLGHEAFPEKKKVFISYRRKDGHTLAEKIYHDLWSNNYEAFLDVFQIEAGAEFQERIIAHAAGRLSKSCRSSSSTAPWTATSRGSRIEVGGEADAGT